MRTGCNFTLGTRDRIALLVFALFYVAFGVYLTLSQEKIVYQPWPQNFNDCPAFANADAVVYEGTRMYVRTGDKGMVVLYHGNAGSACDRAMYAEEFVRAGYGYTIVEYAGYSNDTRVPTHELIRQDVAHVVAYLGDAVEVSVVVVGESVGTGAASYHTSLAPPSALLLISPFASLSGVARRKFWFYPTSLLVENAFDNVALLRDFAGPVTIVHGDADRIISYKSGKLLFESLPTAQKEFVTVPGHGHNDLFSSPVPFETISRVLDQVCRSSAECDPSTHND